MQALMNSVEWAETYLTDYNRNPWHATHLQKEILLSTDDVREVYMPRASGKTELIIIDAIYRLLTQPNVSICIATPTHMVPMWNSILVRIKSNPEIEARLEGLYGKSRRIVATNGSELVCYSTDGYNLRGREFDYLYLDDAEYLPEDQKPHLDRLASKRLFVRTRHE